MKAAMVPVIKASPIRPEGLCLTVGQRVLHSGV